MSSEIERDDSMVSAGNVIPWHKLGTVIAGVPTAAEALNLAKLDWEVVQEPIFDSDCREIETHRLNRRVDTRKVLGVVKNGWEPVQNARLLEIAESLAQVDGQDFRPVIETAGSLRGGQIVWALVKVGERTFADSAHKNYFLLSNGHDGLRAIKGTLTDVRVVCANTLRVAETSVSSLYVSHARGVESRIKAAIETLGWANEASRSTFAIYEALAATSVSKDKAVSIFRDLVIESEEMATAGELRAVDQMAELFVSGDGNQGRSAFDLVNAVTDWVDHKKGFREDEGMAERRFISLSLGGQGDKIKSLAFAMAQSLVTA
jgi:phage/plasmid-like protein (TIGR03299 family)